jgi:hypothetical protein
VFSEQLLKPDQGIEKTCGREDGDMLHSAQWRGRRWLCTAKLCGCSRVDGLNIITADHGQRIESATFIAGHEQIIANGDRLIFHRIRERVAHNNRRNIGHEASGPEGNHGRSGAGGRGFGIRESGHREQPSRCGIGIAARFSDGVPETSISNATATVARPRRR